MASSQGLEEKPAFLCPDKLHSFLGVWYDNVVTMIANHNISPQGEVHMTTQESRPNKYLIWAFFGGVVFFSFLLLKVIKLMDGVK